MATKQIKDFTETTTPVDDSELLLGNTNGKTYRSKLSNLLKKVFSFDDVYDDYIVSGMNLEHVSTSAAPVLKTFRNNYSLHAFENGGQIESGYFTVHIQHGIKPNTNAFFHVHWSNNAATPTGNMKWFIEYSIAKGYGAGTFSSETVLSSVQTVGAQYEHQITNDDDMVIIGINGEIEPDSVIVGRVYRDPSDPEDTLDTDAFLLHVDVHYVKSRTGTKERNRPFITSGWS